LYATKETRGRTDLEKNEQKKKQLPAMTPGLMQVPRTIKRKRSNKSQEEKIEPGAKANEGLS
jgi:hypothetical protein